MENTRPVQPRRRWLDFFPLATLPLAALALGRHVPPWVGMWALAIGIYAGFKWLTWRGALAEGVRPSVSRSLIYLLLWWGMDAPRFLTAGAPASRPPLLRWVWAGAKTVFGACVLWGAARLAGAGLLAGWIGMLGVLFLLHFGFFDLLALFWRWTGINAQPLMRAPLLSASLGDLWGRRWNSAFRDLTFGLWFVPLRQPLGPRGATFFIFLVSGLIHELVISLPAGGGWGSPTAYFVLQGAGLLAEHSRAGKRWGLRGRWTGRAFALVIALGPAFWLFHPPFVLRIMVPFMQAIKAL